MTYDLVKYYYHIDVTTSAQLCVKSDSAYFSAFNPRYAEPLLLFFLFFFSFVNIFIVFVYLEFVCIQWYNYNVAFLAVSLFQ